ncbi:hypothetical protein Q3G72_009608 [Acer saccharum]|nr:hypothetical protein Q3G72_009608 [Acer saccharum]
MLDLECCLHANIFYRISQAVRWQCAYGCHQISAGYRLPSVFVSDSSRWTLTHGLLIRRQSAPHLHAFADADWAGNPDDRRSTTAYVIFYGSTPISWSSKKQHIVARSTTEAEFRAIASTAAELNWIGHLLTELQIRIPSTPVIYCDNVGATYVCDNPIFHSRMKHVAIDFFFVRDQVARQQLRVYHVHTNDQLADSLTKPLSRRQFTDHRSKIGILDVLVGSLNQATARVVGSLFNRHVVRAFVSSHCLGTYVFIFYFTSRRPRVLFTLPHSSSQLGVFSLARWSLLIYTGFHIPHATRVRIIVQVCWKSAML